MVTTVPLRGTHDWTAVEVELTAIPDTVPHVWVELILRGNGKAWFDDVALVRV
jgi:hypothetical protein